MGESGRIIRKRKSFTMVANTAMKDTSLSLQAKGLYAVLNSYLDMESVGFVVYKTFLMRQSTNGKDAFNRAWKELLDAGYLIQTRVRSEQGTFSYTYELIDDPKGKSPVAEKPVPDKPAADNPDAVKPETDNPSVNKDNINSNNTKNTEHNNIYMSTPEDFLKEKKGGAPLSSVDRSVLKLLSAYNFPDVVCNRLIDYVLTVSDNRLVPTFVTMVADAWARSKVRTEEDAIAMAKKSSERKTNSHVRTRVLPAYMTEGYKPDDSPEYHITQAEREELRRQIIEKIHEDD